ncbi:MAG: phosphoribosylglycinamide formyltransferase [Caldisericia bacterium]|nr:phosphoribosylglycinamide formyltransferase [Caldisericia bacterium]
MNKLAILVSGRGTNMIALHKATLDGRLNAQVGLVISNKKDAPALEYCRENNLPCLVMKLKDYPTRVDHANAMIDEIEKAGCNLVVLAGYMLLVPENFVDHFKYRMLNIHPALLPSFPGVDGIKQAFEYGVKFTGVSVIFVSHGCDDGEIIMQKTVEILETDTLEILEEKIHKVEHEIFWQAVKIVLDGKFKIKGRKVEIL